MEEIIADLHARGGRARVIGVTGAAGSGKSTLVGALISELRARERTVGVVAVDPSSSLSGGAILGDRIRMQDHALDSGVFVRSMSTRGWLGGIARATVDAVSVLDAAGWDDVIVETVGVGQAEVEIVQIAQTTVVVSVPGLGDDVQAIKAGLLEVADVHVVNKADRPDANRTIAELKYMLSLGDEGSDNGWSVPVLATASLAREGISELADALDEHSAWIQCSQEAEARQRRMAAARIRAILRDAVLARLDDPAHSAAYDALLDDVVARRMDPHRAAGALIERFAAESPQLEVTA